MVQEKLWKTKVAARLHDPAEKALVLLRDPEGHENGTSRALRRLLGLDLPQEQTIAPDQGETLSRIVFQRGLPLELYRLVQRADWWAAAGDRPQFPLEEIEVSSEAGEAKFLAVASWARVNWAKEPKFIHPLTGDVFDLGTPAETDVAEIKKRSIEHFRWILEKLGFEEPRELDWRKLLLAFWRFGPELEVSQQDGKVENGLGLLWPLLPADTRVPDHSIWDHLDLTSAFAGAFAADPGGEVALLVFAIGPVQPFIAAARKVEDLWAGSHLLSRLAWEAMRPLCEQLGPDAVLFPRLRGVAQVDLWLRDRMGLPRELFEGFEWTKATTDSNPLFAAALPNRFVAIVPASQVKTLATTCTEAVRTWLLERGLEVVDRLLEVAGLRKQDEGRDESLPAYGQMRAQLKNFPEVYWAAVPFSLVGDRDGEERQLLNVTRLEEAMAPFFPAKPGGTFGFLETPAWQVLSHPIELAGSRFAFYTPRPTVLYPALYDLAERLLDAVKAARPFGQLVQEGYRDAITGESEWLTTDLEQLHKSYRQQTDTLWATIAAKKPSWAKKGEHLGALSAIKRLWPQLFAEEVEQATGKQVGRFVVSTHTMALAHQLEQWLKSGAEIREGSAAILKKSEPVALPRRLACRYGQSDSFELAKRIPSLLDAARESEDEQEMQEAEDQVKSILAAGLGKKKTELRLESYYALVKMDGDRMGAILSGDEQTGTAITYRDSFHPAIRSSLDQLSRSLPLFERYLDQRRAISPNRHLAISSALNDFSQLVVRHVIEEEFLGRLIYAGGDDVLAMLPVADVLSCIQRLRRAYSGIDPEDEKRDWGELRKQRDKLHCKGGFAFLGGRLARMMGKNATASCGVVVAHHQAPLSAVMRELSAAEHRAKQEGKRDAFAITVVKRSGGALYLVGKWEQLDLLRGLRNFLAHENTSRRAAFHTMRWLADLSDPGKNPEMLAALLAYQFKRQSEGEALTMVPGLARGLAEEASKQHNARVWLMNFLAVGEFLARETRAPAEEKGGLR